MNIKYLIGGIALLGLSGCFDSDDDPEIIMPDPNNPPSAIDEAFITQTEVSIMESVRGTDPDNDTLTYALELEPSNGVVTVNDAGQFNYTPNVEFTGEDSFTFTATDTDGASGTGTITITVEALMVLFSDLSRDAFAQAGNAQPLRLNGRDVTNDVEDPSAFDDLLID